MFRSIASAGGLGKSALAVPCQVYLCVSNYTTQVFRCQAIGNGESVLQAYPGIVCGTGYHQGLQTVGSIGFIVYMIGYPLGCFAALLYIYKNDLRTDPEMLRMFGWVIPTIQPTVQRAMRNRHSERTTYNEPHNEQPTAYIQRAIAWQGHTHRCRVPRCSAYCSCLRCTQHAAHGMIAGTSGASLAPSLQSSDRSTAGSFTRRLRPPAFFTDWRRY